MAATVFGCGAQSAFAQTNQSASSATTTPLVNITNITKAVYPLSLPSGGGHTTLIYKVTNPGVAPLSDVTVTDNNCAAMSSELGDTNGNHLLDPGETWIYTCATATQSTTVDTATVTAYANGLEAMSSSSITVGVATTSAAQVSSPALPNGGSQPNAVPVLPNNAPSPGLPNSDTNPNTINITVVIWGALGVTLAILVVLLLLSLAKKKQKNDGGKNTRNILLLLIFFLVLAGAGAAGYYFFLLPQSNQNTSAGTAAAGTVPSSLAWNFPASFLKLPLAGTGVPVPSAYSSVPAAGAVPSGLPVRLEIPIIGVDSFIEDAYITPQGAMEVPSGTVDVAWFALGPHPGQVGSAVIGGHFGIQNNVPFVFYNLSKLKNGDNVYIIDDKGNTLTFVVTSSALFAANADATTVFTSTDGLAHLNLITCEGIWNEISGEYPERTVVFTTEVSSTASAPATTLSTSAFTRSLGVGSSGADVSALQTALEQRGFLTMPPLVATGYFGALTSTAVSAFQTSVGLPATGTFGPQTRASLIIDLAKNSVLPYTGLASAATSTISQIIIQSVESLYATPLNALITLVLLIAIGFVIFKIIRS